MTRTPILLALVSLCSCAADDLPTVDCRGQQVTMLQHPAPLADIAALPGFQATAQRITTTGIGFAVDLDYVEPYGQVQTELRDSDGHYFCPQLEPSFAASLDGVAGSLSPGEWKCSHGMFDGPVCVPMAFYIGLTHEPQGKIMFGDDSLSLEIDPPPS